MFSTGRDKQRKSEEKEEKGVRQVQTITMRTIRIRNNYWVQTSIESNLYAIFIYFVRFRATLSL